MTDAQQIATSVQLATDSLVQLKQYSDLRNNSGAWKIELSKNPMPKCKPLKTDDDDATKKDDRSNVSIDSAEVKKKDANA